MISAHDWFYWALLSAVFAALTAIFAKLGIAGIDADFATLFLHERPTPREWVGILFVGAGVFILGFKR